CGSNIASVIDVQSVARYAAELPNVVHAEDVLYACSQDNLEHMKQVIKEHKLNRVLVASCTPRTHEPLFQETIREAGLNKFLFEMADIREQCSWVHSDRPALATEKAKALVRMGVGKARTLKPLSTQRIGVIPAALVIGGGLSGLTAALSLAEGGFGVHLIERERELGGNLRKLYRTLEGEEVQAFLQDLIRRVEENPKIEVYTEAQLLEFSGFVGNFSSLVSTPQGERRVEHGVAIVASGGSEHRPSEYLYGEDERVMTQLELERVIHEAPQELEGKRSIVMIQCVGSRNEERPYCSRVCCGEALKNALSLVERDPDRRIYVLYRDIMTYGLMEGLYRRAREKGVIFIRYDEDRRPQVQRREGRIVITVWDGGTNEDVVITPDLLVLSTGIVPDLGNAELGRRLKVPLDGQGFFCEAHVKLRPVDFASRGIFLCGLSHAPGLIPEAIAKAKAAAGRAATVLAKGYLETGGLVALVDPERCVGCLTCVRECPYSAVSINQEGVAEVEAALCQGCGVCAAECPMKAIQLQGFEDDQEISMLEELFVA
ncbi:MAG: CoB--CoM heterodisulfide reductase iron-sulfur subunit A family protein, partial [Candidatus Bipolaricaulia bacterium]